MESTYRRRQPSSRLERLLARLMQAHTQHDRPAFPVDLVLNADLELARARD